MSYVDKLTEFQNKIGYTPGTINLVALMGLMGEAGEVLDEVDCRINENISTDDRVMLGKMGAHFNYSITAAGLVDTQKKILRSMDWGKLLELRHKGDPAKFQEELADAFYYINILAMGENLTVEDLARISYEKVVAKNTAMKPR